MSTPIASSLLMLCALSAVALAAPDEVTWRYYRPGNTGIQGDSSEALWVAPDGDPYIAAYDPTFEEGGFARFVQAENRWENWSNVDHPVIGHPDDLGRIRVTDIVPDGDGVLWMGTWRGAMTFDPAVGAASINRIGPGNSSLTNDFVNDIDVAPDGSLWFSNNGTRRYDPATGTWSAWPQGNEFLSVQPKATGGYLVWSSTRPPYQDYTFVFDSDTQAWTTTNLVWPNGDPGDVAGLPGKDCVDDAGNLWALRLTAPGDFASLDYRRPDGTWVAPREPYASVTFGLSAFTAWGDRRALLVDGNGTVYRFDGTTWSNLGQGIPGAFTYAVDVDDAGNVWVSGVGGAAKRNALTGQWQRYRITNTGNFDSFNRDLAIDPVLGHVYSGANATAGVGGMVRFDGARWSCWNQLTYGLGHVWPFPNDNCHALAYQPSNGRVAVSPLDWLYGIHEWTGATFAPLLAGGGAERMCEDSLGRLWVLGEYYSLQYQDGAAWTQAGITAWGSKIQPDPDLPGAVWATTGHEIKRTDGVTSFSRQIGDFPELTTVSDTFSGLAAAPGGVAWVGATVQFGAGGTGGALIRLDADDGSYQMLRYDEGWPLPGQYVQPLAVTPDGRVWMQYDSDYLTAQRGLCWYDGTDVGVFPAPPFGEPQWGGLPHAQIEDLEVRLVPGGYELWMSCVSRGIAVLMITSESAWTDQGGALSGVDGDPLLVGHGTLVAGSANSIELSNAAQSAPCGLLLALSGTPVPFKGGVIQPFPFLVDPIVLSTSGTGSVAIPFTMLAGVPTGTELWVQFAIQDAAAVAGFALSNAVVGSVP